MGNIDNVVVENYWVTKPYSDLGLLDILTRDGDVVAEDIDAVIAEYLIKLHNLAWDAIVWESYYDNIMVGIAIDVANYYNGEQAPLPDGVAPLTEDDWFDYDEPYETT